LIELVKIINENIVLLREEKMKAISTHPSAD
jgi:hypothetical protein